MNGTGGQSFLRQACRIALFATPLGDQAVISGGSFLFNAILARVVPIDQYGRFAVVLGVWALLQACCGSLIFYPLSVRSAAAEETERDRLIVSAIGLNVGISTMLAALACFMLFFVDRGLASATFAMLFASQIQESTRRALLAGFRQPQAVPGDALSYLGQVAVLLVVCQYRSITPSIALWIMAGTSLLSATSQLPLVWRRGVRPLPLGRCLHDFWLLGRWALASNLLIVGRMQGVLWLVLYTSGLAAAGEFQIALNSVNAVNPVIFGVCTQIPQVAARKIRLGYRASWNAAWPLIAAGYLLISAFLALLLFFPGQILQLLFGARADFAGMITLVRVLAIGGFFSYAAATTCAFLHGVAGGRDALIVDGVVTLLLAGVGPILVVATGNYGATVALALSYAARAVLQAACTSRLIGLKKRRESTPAPVVATQPLKPVRNSAPLRH